MTATKKTSAVNLNRLLQAAATSMWAEFEKSAASARPDHKGQPREQEVRAFLRTKLPRRFGVARGHIIYNGDQVSNEFDVIIYHAWDAPSWNLDSNASDPRLLIPLEAVAGIVEVKSTLTNKSLNEAIDKIYEIDQIVRSSKVEDEPFRFIFSYKIDKCDNFDHWGSPIIRLCSYSAPKCQPEAVFILDTGYSVLASETGLARSYAIHNQEDMETTLMLNDDFQNDFLNRFVELDPAYCNDYKSWNGKDGSVILPFLTFVIQFCADHNPMHVDYADIFSKWGAKRPKKKTV